MVYQVHRPTSPIPTKLFSRSGTWRIVLTFGLVLYFGAASNVFCQNPNGEELTRASKPDAKGKNIFEAKCATCHGLDGLGGEHAPDIIRRPAVKSLSDQTLFGVIHDGIPEEGMPSFPSIGQEGGHAVVAYIRFLQGESAGDSVPGDPVRGKDIFFGKAGCSSCHQIEDRGQFAAHDLVGFARDRPGNEIRDAILRPSGEQQETANVVGWDGRKFSGMIRNEDNASMQLQDADGRFYLLMKSNLLSVQRKAEDPMPVDYGHRLTSAELGDLVAYILHEVQSGKNEEPHAQD